MTRQPQAIRAVVAASVLLLATIAARTSQETVVVHGIVRDSTSQAPIVGAMVAIRDAAIGTQTDTAGRYRFQATLRRGDTITLVVRRIGYKPVNRRVVITTDTVSADFAMVSDPVQLDAVVTGAIAGAPQRMVVGSAIAQAAPGNVRARGVVTAHASARFDTEEYARIRDNVFLAARATPLSTFSIDVDRASYSNVRRFLLTERRLPPKDAVRTEELINYFPYTYAPPANGAPVAVTADVGAAPWNAQHRLVRIGLQAPKLRLEQLPANNLVFLVDVSGSMDEENKLPLVQRSLRLLVQELRPQDRVALVVYAGQAGLVLPSTPASDKETILDAIERLEAGGSTAGGAGIQLAYGVAKANFLRGGNNRVILATDGDFNVGVSSTAELSRLVEAKRAEGTFLTVLGFGMGNYKDARLEQLAADGNGNYAYIDNLLEARKVFVEELGGTLLTVAKDVKLQVEFNPAAVQAYRLIGYENRLLANRDFDDDQKDAGDLGAGHTVTAQYEIVPVGVRSTIELGDGTRLRYQQPRRSVAGRRDELLQVSVRYKPVGSDSSTLLRHVVRDTRTSPSADFRFASAVAAYGLLLRGADHLGDLSYGAIADLARTSVGADPGGYRAGFVTLVETTEQLAKAVVAQ